MNRFGMRLAEFLIAEEGNCHSEPFTCALFRYKKEKNARKLCDWKQPSVPGKIGNKPPNLGEEFNTSDITFDLVECFNHLNLKN